MQTSPTPCAQTWTAQPLIGLGQVRHTRCKPVHHAFVYGTYFLLLPLRSLAVQGPGALARNRKAALSFYDTDHGDGRGPERGGALAWMEALLQAHQIGDADGEIWLHCYPRVLGYAFKPVSFWYCHRADGSLRAIVAEVNNTFGERHCYILDQPRYGHTLVADKVFHVSPFCTVQGRYRFRFMRSADGQRTVARIDYDDAHGPVLHTSVSGVLQPLTAASIRLALWQHPAQSLAVLLRIHWQALALWRKKVPFFRKPTPPAQASSRGAPPDHDDSFQGLL